MKLSTHAEIKSCTICRGNRTHSDAIFGDLKAHLRKQSTSALQVDPTVCGRVPRSMGSPCHGGGQGGSSRNRKGTPMHIILIRIVFKTYL